MAGRLAVTIGLLTSFGCGARVHQDTRAHDATPTPDIAVVDGSIGDVEPSAEVDAKPCSLDGLENLCVGPGAPADAGRCERCSCCGGAPCAGDCVEGRCSCGAIEGGCGVGHPAKYCCSYLGWSEPRCLTAEHCFVAK